MSDERTNEEKNNFALLSVCITALRVLYFRTNQERKKEKVPFLFFNFDKKKSPTFLLCIRLGFLPIILLSQVKSHGTEKQCNVSSVQQATKKFAMTGVV